MEARGRERSIQGFTNTILLTLPLSYGFHPFTLEGTALKRKVTCSPGKREVLVCIFGLPKSLCHFPSRGSPQVFLSADFLGLFPSPCALRALPDSGKMSPWIVAFLFTEELFIAQGVSPEGEGGVEAPLIHCSGVLLPGFL